MKNKLEIDQSAFSATHTGDFNNNQNESHYPLKQETHNDLLEKKDHNKALPPILLPSKKPDNSMKNNTSYDTTPKE